MGWKMKIRVFKLNWIEQRNLKFDVQYLNIMHAQTSGGHKYRLAKQPHTIFTVSSRILSSSFHSARP